MVLKDFSNLGKTSPDSMNNTSKKANQENQRFVHLKNPTHGISFPVPMVPIYRKYQQPQVMIG